MTAEQQARLSHFQLSRPSRLKLPTEKKNQALKSIANALVKEEAAILAANAQDIAALPAQTTAAFLDRLRLDSRRLQGMRDSLLAVAALADPVGEIAEERTLANGLKLQRVRSPLGVIFLIFEARPNVITEAFALAFKSGNAILLRGGSDSQHSATAIYHSMQRALTECGLRPDDFFWGITGGGHELVASLLKQDRFIDVVVPRGGDGLIRTVTEGTHIPIIKNDRGLCHAYVHADADLGMACNIIINGKTQRPGVCNSLETVLVHSSCAENLWRELAPRLERAGVTCYACTKTMALKPAVSRLFPATDENFSTEYLDLKLNCRVVDSLAEACAHIAHFGSRHSETIITASATDAQSFQTQVDAAAVYWNASTRFTDGYEFGLGGELGISTQKLHVRGPVGLRELTSLRWLVMGNGQVR